MKGEAAIERLKCVQEGCCTHCLLTVAPSRTNGEWNRIVETKPRAIEKCLPDDDPVLVVSSSLIVRLSHQDEVPCARTIGLWVPWNAGWLGIPKRSDVVWGRLRSISKPLLNLEVYCAIGNRDDLTYRDSVCEPVLHVEWPHVDCSLSRRRDHNPNDGAGCQSHSSHCASRGRCPGLYAQLPGLNKVLGASTAVADAAGRPGRTWANILMP